MRGIYLGALLLLVSALLIPASAQQRVDSRTLDGTGNPIPSTTTAPASDARGLIVRPVPGGAVTVTSGTIAIVTPNGDSAMNETLDAVKVVVENVLTSGGQSGAAGVTAYPNCINQAYLNMTGIATTQIVPLTAGELIRVCHLQFIANGTTTVKFVNGTATDCASTQNDVSPTYNLTAQVGLVAGNGAGVVMDNTQAGGAGGIGEALCVTNSAAVNVQVFVRYAKYP